MQIRNSAKALIVKDGKLLCIKKKNSQYIGDVYYTLPGGGQHHGETLADALVRECREEAGVEVNVKELRYIREYIGKNHEYAERDKDMHGLNFMFLCELKGDEECKTGLEPDTYQIGIEWLDLKRIDEYKLYPAAIKAMIKNGEFTGPIYLGDVN